MTRKAETAALLLREGMAHRRAANLEAGLCGCGKPRLPGLRRCAQCKARNDRDNRKRFNKKGRPEITIETQAAALCGELNAKVISRDAFERTCAALIKWARASVRADCASELAAAMGLEGELSWSVVLQHVAILVGQSDAARKRRQRAKPKAKGRIVK